jgi:hypothetical protein
MTKKKKDLFDKVGILNGSMLLISFCGFMFLFILLSNLILEKVGIDLDCINCGVMGYIRLILLAFIIFVTSLWFAMLMILPLIKRWENIKK